MADAKRGGIKGKPGNGTSLLPFIEYSNHLEHLSKVRHATDTGRSPPEKQALIQTKKIRQELTQILERKRK